MRRLWLCVALAFTPFAIASADQPATTDLGALLARVGAAVERYYARAQSIICIETVRIQALGFDLFPDASSAQRSSPPDRRFRWSSR